MVFLSPVLNDLQMSGVLILAYLIQTLEELSSKLSLSALEHATKVNANTHAKKNLIDFILVPPNYYLFV